MLFDILIYPFSVYIDFRFMSFLLPTRLSRIPSFVLMTVWYALESFLNIRLHIYQVFNQRIFYLCGTLLLLFLLFKGSPAKKLLAAIMADSIGYTANFIILPAIMYWSRLSPVPFEWFYQLSTLFTLACTFLIFELIRRKFVYLHGTVSPGCCCYLLSISQFISWSVCSIGDFRINFVNGKSVISVAGSVLYALAGMVMIMLTIHYVEQRLNQLLMKQQLDIEKQHIHALEDMEAAARHIRHDIKNHLLCLKNLLGQKCYAQASGYLDKLTDSVNSLDNPVESGNRFANAIIKEKWAVAEQNGILLSLDMTVPPEDQLPCVLELTAILSNAFDNALEACMRISSLKSPPRIEAASYVRRSRLFFEIKNPVPLQDSFQPSAFLRTWKSDPASHGIGLRNIRAAVERLDGAMELSESDGCFHLCIMLPLNTAGDKLAGHIPSAV